jgi:DNA replication protein DnaC
MKEEIAELLRGLRLRKIAEIYDGEVRKAEKEGRSINECLTRLLRAQWHHQQEKALEWRIRRARMPELWTLESFPFAKQPGVSKRQITALAELEFIPKAENIVFIGETGRGKTGLAVGLLLKALQNGYRCESVKAQDLFDEMGYLNLKPEQTNIFFKLMEERYRKKPTIITTNLEFEEWQGFLGNKAMVDALLSRLRHQCHTIRIKGPSLRVPTA